MSRFYLPPDQCQGPVLTLEDREAYHGLRVLRMRRGDFTCVMDGAGHEFECVVSELDRHKIRLNVIQKHMVPPPPWEITLLQGIPKGKTIETIIQKATELGAFRIVPLLAERTVKQVERDDLEIKSHKWRLAAIEAIKQCGSAWLPRIEVPISIPLFLARGENFDLPLIASLQGNSRHPREWFKAFQNEHQRPPRSVCIWIGPEGDFTPMEVEQVISAGARPITLGRLVLRSDTAAVYSLSILNYELGHLHARLQDF